MVKVDARKDYYADLGVSPNAGTDEIKKQFKRLGERRAVRIILVLRNMGNSKLRMEADLFLHAQKLSNIILTETPGEKSSSFPSSRPFKLLMRFSVTPNCD